MCVGPIGSARNEIDPYISLLPGTQAVYGRFDVKTLSAISYGRLFKKYSLSVRNKRIFKTVDFRGQENREVSGTASDRFQMPEIAPSFQIYLIHIDNWPRTVKQAKTGDLALVVKMVRSLAVAQRIERRLPAKLIHCSTGLEVSCTFYAMFLNRQLHLRFDVVNIKATLQMIERTRYKAFAANSAFDQIKLLHAVVLEFGSMYPCLNKCIRSFVQAFQIFQNFVFSQAEDG